MKRTNSFTRYVMPLVVQRSMAWLQAKQGNFMKKIILLCFIFPAISFAATTKENNKVTVYQELCAKEQDPVKRQNYCYMMENNTQAHTLFNVFRKDVAIV
ncbi:hypothetical protein ACFORL_11805 [Legionella dresdenensis]|uniref:Uncharacterized protein n=1 Tax=Legionella dresdenensis TaxID=450200 RepID=A0ABV8CIB0_9GAMM